MLRGELYRGSDAASRARYREVQALLARYNDPGGDHHTRDALLREMLDHVGDGVVIRPDFFCEYGTISIGAETFANVGVVMLDVAEITIGAHCQLAPRVQLLTAGHPVDPQPRRDGWEFGKPITIADNVWLGAGAIVCPGVSIGEDTVVGAGAVVTKDLPAGVVAGGVPARVIREIGPQDAVEVPAD